MSIVNSREDVNKLVPAKYPWALEHYKKGIANSWQPEESPMATDIRQWRGNDLTDDERRMIVRSVGYFSTAESLVGNNIILAIFKHVTDGPARQYLLRQAYEEANHNMALVYIAESLGLNENEIYNAYKEIESIEAKDAPVIASTQSLSDPAFATSSTQGLQDFVENLIMFYVATEGISFYSGFAMMFLMRMHNKMKGIAEIYEWIFRDEAVHCAFGIDLINTIIHENPEIWTNEFKNKVYNIVRSTVALETAYASDTLPNGLLGITAETFGQYVQYMADRRLERLNLNKLYNVANPFPWISEAADLPKEANFFERKVTEYSKSSALVW